MNHWKVVQKTLSYGKKNQSWDFKNQNRDNQIKFWEWRLMGKSIFSIFKIHMWCAESGEEWRKAI